MRSPKRLLLFVLLSVLIVAGLAACAPVRLLNRIALAGDGYTAGDGIAYGPLDRQRLDIYTPSAAPPLAGWPVVVFFYGGSWSSGDRAEYEFVGTNLASQGVMTLIADYRLYPQVTYPDFLRDSAKALAWGLVHAADLGGDPRRVFVMGHSAGGYNAAMLALDRRWLADTGHVPAELAGWIGLAGPYDFFPSDDPKLQAIFHAPDYPAHGQPIDWTTEPGRPAFLATGDDDQVVSPTRSTKALATELRAAGTRVTEKLYARPSHTLLVGAFALPLRWIAPVRADVLDFIAKTPPAGSTGGS